MVRVFLFVSGLCAVYHPFLWWGCWVLEGRKALSRRQVRFWLFWIVTFLLLMDYTLLAGR